MEIRRSTHKGLTSPELATLLAYTKIVLEGEIEFTVEGSAHAAGPGTLASIPRNVDHTFRHAHHGRARMLNIHAPNAGFADFLRRTAEQRAANQPKEES